jgi:hypothetical protein
MARKHAKPIATQERTLPPVLRHCWECGRSMWISYHNHRRLITLEGTLEITIPIRRCRNRACSAYKQPRHPVEEGALALPEAECGLDLVAFVGACRYQQHRSVPEIHQALQQRDVPVCERTVTNLIARYEELLSLQITDLTRLTPLLQKQGKVILAIDGLQPDVGHEVLWIVREVLSGEVLVAKSLLSSCTKDLAALLQEVKDALPVAATGVISDGQIPLRKAVAQTFPGLPHQLCHFHYLKEAAKPIYEADRHAKKVLKQQVRGVRPLERALEGRDDPEAKAAHAYCQAVRSAITDDGRPPLVASGLQLRDRLQAISTSIAPVEQKGGTSPRSGAFEG